MSIPSDSLDIVMLTYSFTLSVMPYSVLLICAILVIISPTPLLTHSIWTQRSFFARPLTS